jgi:lipopolysaccharide biosynthesis protein
VEPIRDTKAIAFYLPQYHPIPENDEWWGKGFTEWTNVTKCKPGFPGHYQPHLPADLGFYDLRLPEAREAQAALARQFNIHGFCYYHYWFNGRRILERPFGDVLASGNPDFPFCLCWANENWTRAWDGMEREILLKQTYDSTDDLAHIRYLSHAFADHRYIRVGGKPLFAVYRASRLPNPKRTTDIWRQEAERLGIGDLYLCCVESIEGEQRNPMELGFDAAIEFAPDWSCLGPLVGTGRFDCWISRLIAYKKFFLSNRVYEYDELVRRMLAKPKPNYIRHRCVTPSWDNSSRRKKHAVVIVNSTPEKYSRWLSQVIKDTLAHGHAPLVFINAWNEWAEGNHLEPCQRWGRSYLEATLNATTKHEARSKRVLG